jgi:hypothetical protein
MATKLTMLTHKIAIQLHSVAESCIICSSRSRRPVRKHLDTPSYFRRTLSRPRRKKLAQYKQKWLNHVSRMERNRYRKQLLDYRPIGRRRGWPLESIGRTDNRCVTNKTLPYDFQSKPATYLSNLMRSPPAVDECGSSHGYSDVHMHQKHSHPKQPVLVVVTDDAGGQRR